MTVLPGENVPRALLDANRANYRLLEDINAYGALAFVRKANIIKERTDAQLSLVGLDGHLHAPTILTVAQRWLETIGCVAPEYCIIVEASDKLPGFITSAARGAMVVVRPVRPQRLAIEISSAWNQQRSRNRDHNSTGGARP